METNEPEPVKKESFMRRMQREGKLVVKEPGPGDLDMLEKLREALESDG